jgi:hypothetical protein
MVSNESNRDDYDGHRDDEDLHEKDSFFTRCPSNLRVSRLLKDGLRYRNHLGLGGLLVPSSTTNRIKSEKKRSPPTMLPTQRAAHVRPPNVSESCREEELPRRRERGRMYLEQESQRLRVDAHRMCALRR